MSHLERPQICCLLKWSGVAGPHSLEGREQAQSEQTSLNAFPTSRVLLSRRGPDPKTLRLAHLKRLHLPSQLSDGCTWAGSAAQPGDRYLGCFKSSGRCQPERSRKEDLILFGVLGQDSCQQKVPCPAYWMHLVHGKARAMTAGHTQKRWK